MNIKKASFDEIVTRGVEEFPQLWYAVNHDLVALATEDLTRDPMRRMVALAVYRSLDAARDYWATTNPATRAGNQRPQTPNDPESLLLQIEQLKEANRVKDELLTSAKYIRTDGFYIRHEIFSDLETQTVIESGFYGYKDEWVGGRVGPFKSIMETVQALQDDK